ncbi:mirror-image polydactyly gene 1 protein-like [Hydractinia symbiolongicarpus]|uniref:mirror-image polydactyly gene 1 protein-like n=1 Tax=Hydractinia symbiolongicarpus TaxID=13093 RepID=UPI00254A2980|nr:mirror-image polydactyly gene 1 protein-like [Hydractinia symbiolongicarpus]
MVPGAFHLEDDEVENLKESLKDGLVDARRKIAELRKEVKQKNQTINRERELRKRAEHELSNYSRAETTSPILINSGIEHKMESRNSQYNEGLLEELKAARSLNRTLTQKLSHVELELEEVLISKQELKVELEASLTGKGAALVDKIYTAQKERDNAMMTRLKLMSAENEELIQRLKAFEKNQKFDSGVENGSLLENDMHVNPNDLSLNQVVDRMKSSQHSDTIEFHGDLVVEQLNKIQNYKNKRSTSEYQQVKDERDQAREEILHLRDELKDLHNEREMLETQYRKNETNRLKTIQDQMKSVIQERDQTLQHSQQLQEKLEALKLQHSLKNSLSNEATLREQFTTTMDEFESKLNEKESQINTVRHSYDDLLAKLTKSLQDKNIIEKQLKSSIQQVTEERKRADRLERLVDVLRKRKTISISDTID